MIWGCISYCGVGPLMRCSDHMTQSHYLKILNDVALVVSSIFIGSDFILQHDNVSTHAAWNIKKFLTEVGQVALKWPPQSPDLHLIGNGIL